MISPMWAAISPQVDAAVSIPNGGIRGLRELVHLIEKLADSVISFYVQRKELKESLEVFKQRIDVPDESRKSVVALRDIADEPIAQILYPDNCSLSGERVWFDYFAWTVHDNNMMHIDCQRSRSEHFSWMSSTMLEVTLVNFPNTLFMAPLKSVPEGYQREDEIRKGDLALLAGQYLIIAETDRDGIEGWLTTSYLRITGIGEKIRPGQKDRQRRRMNRSANLGSTVLTKLR
ncbi:MAG: hypothetical protein M1828_005349 [Chrysothrix sp. TS-e1954]|nr:MAG: hypothetical protein M1828_005349 [Chrysothrix sp. TS-e1954]